MSSSHHDIFENRKQFQLERMILFSDAVFAIAITLLVIEIKIPELGNTQSLVEALGHHWNEFFGLTLSFVIIGQFWTTHHRVFGYVNNYDGGLLWLNLLVLFWIILMPFSSALNAKYAGMNDVWMFYSFNLFMISISMYFILRHISNPKRNLSGLAHNPGIRKWLLTRSFVMSMIFISGLVLCLFSYNVTSYIARFVFLLIFPALIIVNRRFTIKKGQLSH